MKKLSWEIGIRIINDWNWEIWRDKKENDSDEEYQVGNWEKLYCYLVIMIVVIYEF
jgi:hypothetical protein